MGYTTAVHLANYSALVEVASAALGGENKGGKAKPTYTEDLSSGTAENFLARFAQLTSI